MEKLTEDICLKIFHYLDYQSLTAVNQVCRKWNNLASDDTLWSILFKDRWGEDRAQFYAPSSVSGSWKHVYVVQDRCDRIGLGLKIIREGGDYYLVHKGEIKQHLGSRRQRKRVTTTSCPSNSEVEVFEEGSRTQEESRGGILDNILFFIGDLEVASADAKRSRVQ
ncbi:hypothetical protein ACFE04_009066 [Oxalis oulophora]